jgi:hypothetical protein
MKLKKKLLGKFSKKSILLLIVFALITMLSFSAVAQNSQEKIESIKNYINENEVESLSHPLVLMLERRIDENNEISTDYIYALIDSYAEGEIESGQVFAAVNNMNSIQNNGVSVDEIDEFTSNTEDIDNQGMVVSNYAHQLAEFAKEIKDEEYAGEEVREMAQEFASIAADKGNISEENMISVREKRRNEIMENRKNNSADGKEISEEKGKSANAEERGSENKSDKASEKKPDNAEDKSENNPKN